MSFNFDAVKDVLRCPKSHSELVHRGEALICTDPTCRLKYEIRDDIPVMLIDEAVELSEEQWSAAVADPEEPR